MIRAFPSISLDGFIAGPNQTQAQPLGENGESLHTWAFGEKTPADAHFLAQRDANIGAYVMGRNMFGPVRGPWPDDSWRGWWGEDPPYHVPVYVLTQHERAPLAMDGGTTFHFVTAGPEAALELAREAAGGRDIAIAGGASTIRQYLELGLLDQISLSVAPVVLGAGESPFPARPLTLDQVACVSTAKATHITYAIRR